MPTSENDEAQPQVRMGDVTGSTFAIGSHARATTNHGAAAARDSDAEELLEAIRELRADLARVRATGATADLDAELAGTEDELARTGAAAPSRRQRLRELLGDSASLMGLLTSAGNLAGLLGIGR
jgi:ribosomal protein L29